MVLTIEFANSSNNSKVGYRGKIAKIGRSTVEWRVSGKVERECEKEAKDRARVKSKGSWRYRRMGSCRRKRRNTKSKNDFRTQWNQHRSIFWTRCGYVRDLTSLAPRSARDSGRIVAEGNFSLGQRYTTTDDLIAEYRQVLENIRKPERAVCRHPQYDTIDDDSSSDDNNG